MATKKISALPAAGPITGAELLPAVQGGTTVGVTAAALAAAGGGGAFPAPVAATFGATTTITAPSANTGPLSVALTATGNTTLGFAGEPVAGQVVVLEVLASGAPAAVTLPATVAIPSSSAAASPVTVAAGTVTVFAFRWSALRSKWLLVSLVPGY